MSAILVECPACGESYFVGMVGTWTWPSHECGQEQEVERCDKCGAPIDEWKTTECARSLTRSSRHSITRYRVGMP